MKIVLASRNLKKIREMDAILKEIASKREDLQEHLIEILSLDDIGFFDDIEETGLTFEENAIIKASAVAKYGYIGVADDSGLSVDALDGAPGVYSARYSGEDATDEKNNNKLLSELSGIDNRTGRFVSVIACVFPGEVRPILVQGECEGEILHQPRGNGGFGYDSLFYFPPMKKSFAELTEKEKNTVSHRGRALCAFASIFYDKINQGIAK